MNTIKEFCLFLLSSVVATLWLPALADTQLGKAVVTPNPMFVDDKPAQNNEPELTEILSDIQFKVVQAVSPFKNYALVICTVKNGSPIPITVNGDGAQLVDIASPDAPTKTASQRDIDQIGKPPTRGKDVFRQDLKSTLIAAVTVGGVQTLEGFKQERKPVVQRYEYDEERRQHEEERLGERLLYPGDSTTGNLYFPISSHPREGMSILCPVKSFYTVSNQALLRGKIEGSAPVQQKPERQ